MSLFKLFWRYAPFAMIAILLLSAFYALLATSILYLINKQFLMIVKQGISWYFIGVIVIALVFLFVSNYFSDTLVVTFSQRLILDLRLSLCQQILAPSFAQVEKWGLSRLQTVLTDDMNNILTGLQSCSHIVLNIILLMGCVIYLGFLSWKTCAFELALCVIYIGIYKYFSNRARQYYLIARKLQDELYRKFEGVVLGFKELKQHAKRREYFLKTIVTQALDRQAVANISATNAMFLAFNYIRALMFFNIFLVLICNSFLGLTFAQLSAIIMLLLYVTRPISMLISFARNFYIANASWVHIEKLGFKVMFAENNSTHSPILSTHELCNIRLQDICYTYDVAIKEEQAFTVGPINLVLRPGKIIFVVGHNGSGKSTFMKLLTGLYPWQEGRVILNEEEITLENMEHYRQYFSCIHENFYLFETLMGLQSIQPEDYEGYMEKLELQEKIKIEGESLSTIKLSQGQRKRLALLVAYLEKRPILIFDEWASDQDPVFKEVFYYQLLPELKAKNKCLVVVSHDNRYFDVADEIYQLTHGKFINIK